jgi:hypothetical protein
VLPYLLGVKMKTMVERKGMHPNNIRNFIAGRRIYDVAYELGLTTQSLNYYMQGAIKPHPLRMHQFLTVLGKPFGRVLDESEVWYVVLH